MFDWLTGLFDPKVSQHLISDDGEVIIDEVRKHRVVMVVPALIVLAGALLLVLMSLARGAWWLVFFLGLVVGGIGLYRALREHMDRFVITNMRVFRVYGVVSRHTATMPMSRILDIEVNRPLAGRLLNYGHFVFESAAQDQALRDIRFVGRPNERDLTIQRVIQRSGLRSRARPKRGGNSEDGT